MIVFGVFNRLPRLTGHGFMSSSTSRITHNFETFGRFTITPEEGKETRGIGHAFFRKEYTPRTVTYWSDSVEIDNGLPEEVYQPTITWKDGKYETSLVVDGFVGNSEEPSFYKYSVVIRIVGDLPPEEMEKIARRLRGVLEYGRLVVIDLRKHDPLIGYISEGVGKWLVQKR